MRHTFKFLTTLIALFAYVESRSQTNKPEVLYFLADTVNTAKENRYFVKYTSWKELSDSLHKYGNNFPKYFKLVVVEALPSKKYKIIDDLKYVIQKNQPVQ